MKNATITIIALAAVAGYIILMNHLPDLLARIFSKMKWLSVEDSNGAVPHECDYIPDSGSCTQCTLNAARAIMENAAPPEKLFRF